MLWGEDEGEAGGVPLVSVGEAAAEICSPRLEIDFSLPSNHPQGCRSLKQTLSQLAAVDKQC